MIGHRKQNNEQEMVTTVLAPFHRIPGLHGGKIHQNVLALGQVGHVLGLGQRVGDFFCGFDLPHLQQTLSGLVERFSQQFGTLRVSFGRDDPCQFYLFFLK